LALPHSQLPYSRTSALPLHHFRRHHSTPRHPSALQHTAPAPNLTTPHHTAPHRTTPHRSAAHRTASPRRTAQLTPPSCGRCGRCVRGTRLARSQQQRRGGVTIPSRPVPSLSTSGPAQRLSQPPHSTDRLRPEPTIALPCRERTDRHLGIRLPGVFDRCDDGGFVEH
jgi:hypothetical protein